MSGTSADWTVTTFKNIGHRVENEDRLLVLCSPTDGSGLFVVADGFGGHAGGGLAAETLIKVARRTWLGRPLDLAFEVYLEQLLREAHSEVRRIGEEHGLDPRCTLAALIVNNDDAISIHAGDSRIMQFSESKMVERTLDHSLAQLNPQFGTTAEDRLGTRRSQARLYRYIGGPELHEAQINRWNLCGGRRFVVCSDGFWQAFAEEEVVEVFSADEPETELNRRLQQKLEQHDDLDNITAILIDVPM